MPLGVSQEELISRADSHPRSFAPLPGEFLPRCLEALKEIVKATGAYIVLSSSWRADDAQFACIDACLAAAGLSPCAGATPSLPPRQSRRAAEILAWISEADERSGRREEADVNVEFCDDETAESKDARREAAGAPSVFHPSVWPAGGRVGAYVALDDQDLCAAAASSAGEQAGEHKAQAEQRGGKIGGRKAEGAAAEGAAAARALEPHFCRTDAATGLTMSDAACAIRILRRARPGDSR